MGYLTGGDETNFSNLVVGRLPLSPFLKVLVTDVAFAWGKCSDNATTLDIYFTQVPIKTDCTIKARMHVMLHGTSTRKLIKVWDVGAGSGIVEIVQTASEAVPQLLKSNLFTIPASDVLHRIYIGSTELGTTILTGLDIIFEIE